MQTTKPAEVGLRTQFCRSICSFSEAVQDYVSNIEAMPDSSVTLGRGSPGEIPAGSVENLDPYVFGPPGSGTISTGSRSGTGSFYHQAKIVRETSIPTVLFCDFFMTFYLSKMM
jgi:hypothetical protein